MPAPGPVGAQLDVHLSKQPDSPKFDVPLLHGQYWSVFGQIQVDVALLYVGETPPLNVGQGS